MTPPVTPRRRADDHPEWPRLLFAFVVLGAGIALRVTGFIGEPVLVLCVFAAGVAVKDESILGLARIWRKQP